MNHKLLFLLALLLAMPATLLARKTSERGYVVVTDYIKSGTGKDVSDDIQRVIDTHPNRTIFFPDGIYIISKPILTPADRASPSNSRTSPSYGPPKTGPARRP